MSKKTGTLIKEARTGAGFTQEQLARKITGLSASDIGRAERGEKDLTQEQLKAIAKACGVTQKSLLDSVKGSTAKKTSSAGKTTAKKTTAKKTSSAGSSSLTLTAKEKKLIKAYRAADESLQAKVEQLLLAESATGEMISQFVEEAIKKLTGKK